MGKTKISWTDESSNPIRAETIEMRDNEKSKRGWHCVKVSQGCKNCYAERLNKRFGTGMPYSVLSSHAVKTVLDEKELKRWGRIPKGRKVFVCDMTDLFGEHVSDEQIANVFAAMALNPRVTFQVLTKRARRMMDFAYAMEKDDSAVIEAMQVLADKWGWIGTVSSLDMKTLDVHYDPEDGGLDTIALMLPLPNVWLGVSVEDQRAADERIPFLLETPATVRFLSCEPLLGKVSLQMQPDGRNCMSCGDNDHQLMECHHPLAPRVDWVICGGESGPNYREMDLDWARSLRDQCVDAGLPFFFKQVSGYRPQSDTLLDGVEWHQFPEVTNA